MIIALLTIFPSRVILDKKLVIYNPAVRGDRTQDDMKNISNTPLRTRKYFLTPPNIKMKIIWPPSYDRFDNNSKFFRSKNFWRLSTFSRLAIFLLNMIFDSLSIFSALINCDHHLQMLLNCCFSNKSVWFLWLPEGGSSRSFFSRHRSGLSWVQVVNLFTWHLPRKYQKLFLTLIRFHTLI